MKKVISLLMILVMVMALAACGKKDTPSEPGNEVTKAAENKNETEPTKAAETTPEPTKEVTPEPTKEVTPEPTQEVTPEPTEKPTAEPDPEPEIDPEDDEFYGPGHVHVGTYLCENGWTLTVEPEGAGTVIFVFPESTDKETFGSYFEFWANYSTVSMVFTSPSGRLHYFEEDEMKSAEIEEEQNFEVVGSLIRWLEEDLDFVKYSSDTSDNPLYIGGNYYSGDVGDGFGAEFELVTPHNIDIVATTFYGVCYEAIDDPGDSYFYPYYGDEMSMDTMDEFNAAYLVLGPDGDQGEFCFLEKGINNDVTWTLEDGRIILTNTVNGEQYEGLFYWDTERQSMYVCVSVDIYDVWMTYSTEIVTPADEEGSVTAEMALQAVSNYLNDTHPELAEKLATGEYNTAIGVTEENGIQVWVRSYTGAYLYYYVDKTSGDVQATEWSLESGEVPIDETLNIWDYLN
ncbi:MAG: hypothetical protein K6E62_10305 [Lachnospiraceae bacterium]|nr:hypothetical protein [Lachnospiraceae bacterium]